MTSRVRGTDRETSRLEAFSDGVMAIAITLLVLDLSVPARNPNSDGALAHQLLESWPSYLAYVVSFLVIGIIWVNHHAMFAVIERVDRGVLFANLLLLMAVSVIPFPTRLLAEYLTAGQDAHTAAAVYSGTMVLTSIAFIGLYLAGSRDQRLLRPDVDRAAMRRRLPRFAVGLGVYLLTVALAFVSAVLTLLVHLAIALYYCFDQLTSPDPNTPSATGSVDR
jgi:uncharacterized membrane protein